MNRSKLKDSIRSPSLTPPGCVLKHLAGTKKKPPVHHKNRPSDITNQAKGSQTLKAPTPKRRSNKSRTNSITPKTLKPNLFEKMHHNSNLSDTDISAKYLDNRLNSKVTKSLVNRLELTQKIKDFKKTSGPYIDKIIRKSLNKAKQRKISQEKENKEQQLEREIRRNEISLQNKQIREQNCTKFKSGKKKQGKNRWDSRNGLNNTVNGRSESSSKVRNYTGSLLIEPDARNKRSVSIGDYYTHGGQRKSDPYVLEYIDIKNNKRKEHEEFQYLKKKAAEVSKAHRMKNLDEFTRFRNRSPLASPSSIENISDSSENELEEEGYIKRNISFIDDRKSEESLPKESCEEDPIEDCVKTGKKRIEYPDDEIEIENEYEYENSLINARNQLPGKDSDYEDSLDERSRAAGVIQKWFRKWIISKYLKRRRIGLRMCSGRGNGISILGLQKNNFHCKLVQHKGNYYFPVKKSNNLKTLTPENTSIKILPIRKPALKIAPNPAVNISILPLPKPKALITTTSNLQPIHPNPKPKSNKSAEELSLLKEQLYDQITWNSAQLYLIEQLRSFELSSISEHFSEIPQSKHSKILSKINCKYQAVIDHLNLAVESSHQGILENLPLENYNLVSREKQRKQESLHKLLMEAVEECPVQNTGFSIQLQSIQREPKEVGVQQSGDMSSDDSSEQRYGITHSRSLSQLHGEVPQNKYVGPQKDSSNKFPVFFDIDDTIEVQSVNLIGDSFAESNSRRTLPNLPNIQNLPMLHLDQMQQDLIYSDPRISTSSDFIQNYLRSIFSCLNFPELLEKLSSPITREVLAEMMKLEEKDFGMPSEVKIYDFPVVLDVNQLLSMETDDNDMETTLRQIGKADKIHKRMLLEVLNGALQQFRPYGCSGEPFPWSSKQRLVKFTLSSGVIMSKILKDFEILSEFQIGRIFNEEIITSEGGIDDELISRLRGERVERLLFFETREEEHEWVDYEFEETQTKFDLADMILEVLAEEVVNLLNTNLMS